MGRGWSLLVLLVCMRPATVGADSFVEASGGVMTPGGRPAWTDLADPSPKLAVRAGTMDRRWADQVVSVDWTPIRTERADTSAHRIRALGSYAYNTRASALDLSVRAGVGLDFLRVRSGAASDTLVGYAGELGVGV